MDPNQQPDFRRGDDATEREELQRLAPTLFGLPKADPFVVPPHFFDQLPHAVQAKVAQQDRGRRFPLVWRLAIAAPVVLVLIGAWWFLRERPTTDSAIATVDVLPTEDDLDVLDEEVLFTALSVDGAASALTLGTGLTDDELLSYLENEHPDLNELINEL